MAKSLYCPECETEYWGNVNNAVCGECNHVFTAYEISKALDNTLDYVKESNVNSQS